MRLLLKRSPFSPGFEIREGDLFDIVGYAHKPDRQNVVGRVTASVRVDEAEERGDGSWDVTVSNLESAG